MSPRSGQVEPVALSESKLQVVNHRMANVAYTESTNSDPRPMGVEISLVVIHGISLPPGRFGTGLVHQLFLNTLDPSTDESLESLDKVRVSAHLFIERTGTMTQFVEFDRCAWHAGESEFEGVSNCNDYSIGIELEGTDDLQYADAQYLVLTHALEALLRAYPRITSSRIVGQSDVAPGRKTDPGSAFDWRRVRNSIGYCR
ncbi:MAG: 1,6-anhydro-N-acetylmuramyl-L-alanine amidase AmpD [Pseudomonadales bacterium]|nr:1,6-anhydro-N-acetylmuramyl-L-alanine amidase AmpD [Pseudomonadales bacterium]